MLRFPKLRTRDFVEVIPELGTIEEGVLERVDIDGTPFHEGLYVM